MNTNMDMNFWATHTFQTGGVLHYNHKWCGYEDGFKLPYNTGKSISPNWNGLFSLYEK